MLRVGILGCGRVVRLAHLAVLTDHPRVEVVAIADVDEASRAFARDALPQARVTGDLHELLSMPNLDAAVIALPPPWHREAAEAAFERGLHVYLEKPIATTVEDGEAIVAAWREAGTVGRIGFNLRFNRLYQDMRRALRDGVIGTAMTARTSYTANWPTEAPWRVKPAAGGGALLELASHHIDLCRFLFDAEVAEVQATTWAVEGDDESAMVQLRLDDLRVQLHVCYGTVEEDRVEVYGSEGKLFVDRYDSLAMEVVPPRASGGITTSLRRVAQQGRALPYGLEKRRAPGQEPSYRASLAAFVSAAEGTATGSPDLDDGLRSVQVVDAARRSARRGERVSL